MEARTEDLSNIGQRGIDLRLKRAVVGVGSTLIVMIVLSVLRAPPWALAFLFLPFFVTLNLAYQALFKTCSYMATRGMRDLGDGSEKIANPAEAAAMRARGRTILFASFATALVATSIAVLASIH